MTAWGTSWGRRAIALRIKGITIDVGHAPTNQARDLEPPNELPTQLGVGVSTEPTRLATDAERDQAGIPAPWYAPELAPPAALSPWEHQTMWFTLGAIDADIQARAAAGGDA